MAGTMRPGERTGTGEVTGSGEVTTQASRRAAAARGYEEPTGWVGWGIFAAVMMMIVGGLQVVYGLIAVINDTWVVWSHRADLWLNFTAWGWIHIALGAVVFLAGLGVMTGNVVARAVAVALAGLSFIANFFFIPAYPLWSLAVMAVDVLVIWALTAHGSEMRTMWGDRRA